MWLLTFFVIYICHQERFNVMWIGRHILFGWRHLRTMKQFSMIYPWQLVNHASNSPKNEQFHRCNVLTPISVARLALCDGERERERDLRRERRLRCLSSVSLSPEWWLWWLWWCEPLLSWRWWPERRPSTAIIPTLNDSFGLLAFFSLFNCSISMVTWSVVIDDIFAGFALQTEWKYKINKLNELIAVKKCKT